MLPLSLIFVAVLGSIFAGIASPTDSGALGALMPSLLELDLTPLTAVLMMVALLIVLGCFIDQVSMMPVTLPFYMPLAAALQIDVVWLGVLMRRPAVRRT